ncbi:MAG: hypothetical protein GY884_19130 [Proteobacteria bacterium]|nr:hypothetical protein [Pseudomonadota bacterium]
MARTSPAKKKTTTRKTSRKAAPKKTSSGRTRTRAKASPAAPQPSNRRNVGYLSALATCAFTILSLASYSATDPAFSRRSSVEEVANWCGRWGALLADLLYQTLGWSSWAVLLLTVWLGLRFARRGQPTWGRLAAGVFGTWWSATLIALLFYPSAGGDFPAGGVLGDLSASWLLAHVGTVGSYVIAMVLLLSAATVFFGINWEALAGRGVDAVEGSTPKLRDGLVSGGQGAWSGVRSGTERLKAWWAERRATPEWDEEGLLEESLDMEPELGPESIYDEPEPSMARAPEPVIEPVIERPNSPVPTADEPVDISPPAPRERRKTHAPGLGIRIDSREPEVGVGGISGVHFEAPTVSGESVEPTQVQRRELVEVEYDPTEAEASQVATPRQPPAARTPLPSQLGRGRDSEYDVALARPSQGQRDTSAPYMSEAPMGDGSVYHEPGTRASGFDVVEPMFVRPSVHDEPLPSVHDELPAPAEPSIIHAPRTSVVEPAAAAVVEEVVEAAPPRPADNDRPERRVITPDVEPRIRPGHLVSGGGEDVDLIVRPSEPDISWELPPISLLDTHDKSVGRLDEDALKDMAAALVQKLADFNVRGEVTAIRPGPVITIFEYLPAPGIKVSRIANLTDDIAMAMRALRVRIVAPIPGKGVVGIEIPNKSRQTVWYRDMMISKEFRKDDHQLPMCIGKTTEGRPYVADLAKMPHLLVGGTTGSGKSVGINAMLCSMLYMRTPEELRMILVDPKMLEFELYNDIPHLLHPVVTEPKLAAAALKWACDEMDTRYRMLARWGTRNIISYNKKVEKELADWTPKKARRYAPRKHPEGQPLPTPKKLPYIVVVIDELADLMMVASKDVEESIVRLAQKARACGIHLIVATQRPSVDVITGLIKANMPTRIAFQVRSKTDGRTILDQNGAETLLGKGDMLVLPPGVSALMRCHGPFVADEEVSRITDFWRDQGEPSYDAQIRVEDDSGIGGVGEDEYDENYDIAVQIVTEAGKASTSMIQRRLKIGYNRAARIIEMMEREGVVGPADGARPRKVLVGHMEA